MTAAEAQAPVSTNTDKDAELHAYLDGELAPAAVVSVETRLSADIDARVLMKSLAIQGAALKAKYPLPVDCPKTRAMIDVVLGSGSSDAGTTDAASSPQIGTGQAKKT